MAPAPKIHFQIHSSQHPQVIVFIHGASVSSAMWEKQVAYFSKKFQVITYDLRGHGKTGKIDTMAYTIDLFAEDLKNLLDYLNLDHTPVICGISLGGMILQNFAVKYPEHYAGIILCNTAVSLKLTFWDHLMTILFPEWLMISSLRMYSVKRFARQSFKIAKWTRGRKWLGEQATVQYLHEELEKMDKEEWIKTYQAIYSFRKQPLTRIKKPALIIMSEHEPASIFKHAELMQREIENSALVVIKNAGHVPNLDQPDAFNQEIEIFLNKTYLSVH
jgi:pimeloyl-ACP methyl ester carboxylesterase